jgi:RNase P protein component
MTNLAERLILPLALVSSAVALSIIFSPTLGVGIVVGAIGQARVERERMKRRIREAQLKRRATLYSRYGGAA